MAGGRDPGRTLGQEGGAEETGRDRIQRGAVGTGVDREVVGGRAKPGHDGVDGPLTASVCQSWVVATPTDGSHP